MSTGRFMRRHTRCTAMQVTDDNLADVAAWCTGHTWASSVWQRRYDASIRHPTEIPIVPIDAIRRAMDGCECATWATDHCPKCLDGAS